MDASVRIVHAGLALFVCAAFYLPASSYAWGKFGHLTVCDLAYRNLTPDSRVELQRLLHSKEGGIEVKGRGKLEDRVYTSLNVGCLEEDELPRRHANDHFINVERSTTNISSSDCQTRPECIFSGIDRDFETLKDASKPDEERVFALMALGHWIGDIHQPLHVSFSDDKGGNGIDVDMKARCGTSKFRPKNLHAVWDNCLPEAGLFERVRQRADYKADWSRFTITYRAVDSLQANTSLADEKKIVEGDPASWAEESYQITISPKAKYCVKKSGACHYSSTIEALTKDVEKRVQTIDDAYLRLFAPVAQERLRRAGFRLADLLNKALDPRYSGPVANSTQKAK